MIIKRDLNYYKINLRKQEFSKLKKEICSFTHKVTKEKLSSWYSLKKVKKSRNLSEMTGKREGVDTRIQRQKKAQLGPHCIHYDFLHGGQRPYALVSSLFLFLQFPLHFFRLFLNLCHCECEVQFKCWSVTSGWW